MRKFLSRRDKRRSLLSEGGKSDNPSENKGANGSELESVQEDSASIFGSSSRISRRASLLTESFSFLKPEDTTNSSARNVVSSNPSFSNGSDIPHRKNHILSSLSTRKSGSSLYPGKHQQEVSQRRQQFSVQRLVDPEWDSTIIKTGWLNLVDEESKDDRLRLCRAELKGSSLYIYRPPQELANTTHFVAALAEGDIAQDNGSFQQEQAALQLVQKHARSSSQIHLGSDHIHLTVPDEPKNTEMGSENGSVSVFAIGASGPGSAPTSGPPSVPVSISVPDSGPGSGPGSGTVTGTGVSPSISLSSGSLASLKKPEIIELVEEIQQVNPSNGALDDQMLAADDLRAAILSQAPNEPFQNGDVEPAAASSLSDGPSIQEVVEQMIAGEVSYKSSVCPHPDLKFEDENGVILGGTMESICHTIAFYPSQDVAEKLIRILPMVTTINVPLAFFQRYLELFKSVPSNSDPEEDDEDIEFGSYDDVVAGHVLIPFEIWHIMISRISRSLKVISTYFTGMLLDDTILRSVWNVLVALDGMCDCSDLKLIIHEQQKSLRLLLQFEDPAEVVPLCTLDSDQFLSYPLDTLAYEINALDHKFLNSWNARLDRSLSLDKVHQHFDYWRKNFLIFDANNTIHYLGRLLAFHLFEDTSAKDDVSRRARLLEKWILLGEMLYRQGNMTSWLGIATFICSVPVLRLRETWGRMDRNVIDVARKSWAPIIFEVRQRKPQESGLELYRVLVPAGIGREYSKEDVVPYYGDIHFCKERKELPRDFVKSFCEFSQKADCSIAKWDEFYESIQNSDSVKPTGAAQGLCGKMDSKLAQKLRSVINFNSSAKPFSLEDAMTKSLYVEKPAAGQYYKYHNISRSPLFLGSYASILFPKVLDSYEIYDRKSLVGAIGGIRLAQSVLSNSASNLSNLMKLNNRGNIDLNGMNRNTFLKHIRDVFNIDTFEFQEKDNSIIFKTVLDPSEQEQRNTKRTSKSRPSSVLFGENTSVKRFSCYSTSSFNLDDYVNSYHAHLKDSTDGDEGSAKPRTAESITSPRSSTDVGSRNRFSLPEQTVSILAAAATTNRLLDLLVLTSSIFSARIKDDEVKEYAEKTATNIRSISLKMDQGTFSITFFAVYRCFLSPLQLVAGLHERFAGARACSASISRNSYKSNELIDPDFQFPDWSPTVLEYMANDINWRLTAQIQLGVVESLLTLFEYYYNHLLDDLKTRDAIELLLDRINHELEEEWPRVLADLRSRPEIDPEYVHTIDDIVKDMSHVFKDANDHYLRNCYIPVVDPLPLRFTSELSIIPADKILPRHKDVNGLVQFVNGIDETIRRIMSNITVEDWIETFEILEVLTAKSTLSLFNYDVQRQQTSVDLLLISNIYHWIATLVDSDSGDLSFSFVVDKFPSQIRAIFQFYFKLKNYFTVQIVDPSITSKQRIERMETVLKCLTIARIEMRGFELFNPSEADTDISPRVPSLIESCLVNTILSPESRFFSFDWSRASQLLSPDKELDTNYETLEDLLPEEDALFREIQTSTNLTPCPGWILQSLLEITCFIPNMYVRNTSLINFDKDRFAYNCVVNIMDLVPRVSQNLEQESPFGFLLDFKTRPADLMEAYETSTKELILNGYDKVGIFKVHIDDQRKLMKLEADKKKLLAKQKTTFSPRPPIPVAKPTIKTVIPTSDHQPQKPISFNSSDRTLIPLLSHSASSIHSNSSGESRLSRFKFSGLFSRASRGLSLVHSNSSRQSIEMHPSLVSELPVAGQFSKRQKSKTLYTLNLKDSQAFQTYGTPYTFKIDFGNENPEEYCFQAAGDGDRDDWLRKLNYSHRHWFFSKSLNRPSMGVPANMVFGVPLEFVCSREKRPLPNIIEKILSELEYRGLEEVGLYRRSASLAAIQKIKDKINRMGDFNMEDQLVFDVHNLTGCVKCYLRELPDPIIGDAVISRFTKVKELSKDDRRFDIYRDIFRELPAYNYNLLERLARHLRLVVEYQQYNRMTSSNLATILGGSLIEGCSPQNLRNYFGLMTFVCEDLILNYDQIFLKTKPTDSQAH